jgi:hypothetical protein
MIRLKADAGDNFKKRASIPLAPFTSWDMVSRSAKKYLGLGAIVALLLLLYYHGGSRTGQRSSADVS